MMSLSDKPESIAIGDPLLIEPLADAVRETLARARRNDVEAKWASWEVARQIAEHAAKPEVMAAAANLSPRGPGRPRAPRRVVAEELAKILNVTPRTLVRRLDEWEEVASILGVPTGCGQVEFMDIMSKNSAPDRVEELLDKAFSENSRDSEDTKVGDKPDDAGPNLAGKSEQPDKEGREAPGGAIEPKRPGGEAGAVQHQDEPSAGLHPFWTALKDHGALSDQGADRLTCLDRDRQVQLFGQVCERAGMDVISPDEIDDGLAAVLKDHVANLLGQPVPDAGPEQDPGPTPPQSGAKGDITLPFTPPGAEVVVADSGPVLEVSAAEWRNEIATAMADERAFVSHLKSGLLIRMKEASK